LGEAEHRLGGGSVIAYCAATRGSASGAKSSASNDQCFHQSGSVGHWSGTSRGGTRILPGSNDTHPRELPCRALRIRLDRIDRAHLSGAPVPRLWCVCSPPGFADCVTPAHGLPMLGYAQWTFHNLTALQSEMIDTLLQHSGISKAEPFVAAVVRSNDVLLLRVLCGVRNEVRRLLVGHTCCFTRYCHVDRMSAGWTQRCCTINRTVRCAHANTAASRQRHKRTDL
jgi:hypothetical protein